MFKKLCRIELILLVLCVLFAGLSAPKQVEAADFPTNPIQLIVPYAPGGVTDIVGRLISEKSREFLGQPMVVVNKPGAGGTLGTDFVAKSAPDGYSLGTIGTGTFAIAPILNPNLPYDPVKALTLISRLTIFSLVIMVRADSPLNTLEKLVDYAKKNPGKLNYGSAGVGTALHFGGELFNRAAGIRMVHVPFKGTPPALMALLGGHIDLFFSNYIDAVEQVKAGKVIPLAVTTPERVIAIPHVPTVAEKGYPDAVITSWIGITGPAGITPLPIVDKLSAFIRKVLSIPDIQKKMITLGVTPAHLGPKEFEKFAKDQLEQFRDLARTANIKAE